MPGGNKEHQLQALHQFDIDVLLCTFEKVLSIRTNFSSFATAKNFTIFAQVEFL